MVRQTENQDASYLAKTFANTYTRTKHVFDNIILLSYGDAASSFCCSPELKSDTLSCMIPNGKMIRVDTKKANQMGFIVEEVRSRFIKFYDEINSINVEIGLKYGQYIAVSESLKQVIGENSIVDNHSFLGVKTSELLSYSKLITVDGFKVLVPSYIHQLAMLYSLWLSEADGSYNEKHSNEIKDILTHHFFDPKKLKRISSELLINENPRYVSSMYSDLESMLRE